jgi:hypothetical protein
MGAGGRKSESCGDSRAPPSPARAPACGSVSAGASKYSWFDEGRDFSGGFQHTQDCCGAAKEVERTVVGGDLLIGSGTEEVAQLVVGATECASRSWAFEPAHRTIATFDTAMILLQAVIETTGCRDAEHLRRHRQV